MSTNDSHRNAGSVSWECLMKQTLYLSSSAVRVLVLRTQFHTVPSPVSLHAITSIGYKPCFHCLPTDYKLARVALDALKSSVCVSAF